VKAIGEGKEGRMGQQRGQGIPNIIPRTMPSGHIIPSHFA